MMDWDRVGKLLYKHNFKDLDTSKMPPGTTGWYKDYDTHTDSVIKMIDKTGNWHVIITSEFESMNYTVCQVTFEYREFMERIFIDRKLIDRIFLDFLNKVKKLS